MEKIKVMKEILGGILEQDNFYFFKEILDNFRGDDKWEAFTISKIIDTLYATNFVSLEKYFELKDIILEFMWEEEDLCPLF